MECISFPILLLEIVVFIVVCGIILSNDVSEIKEPFDINLKKFSFWKDYWPLRWDNIIKRWCFGLLGALISGELGMYMVSLMIDLPDTLEAGLDLTVIAVCTYYAPKLFSR